MGSEFVASQRQLVYEYLCLVCCFLFIPAVFNKHVFKETVVTVVMDFKYPFEALPFIRLI